MSARRLVISLAVLCTVGVFVTSISNDPVMTFDVLYNAGIEAYVDEKWSACLDLMDKALKDYKYYTDSVVSCKVRCEARSTNAHFAGLYGDGIVSAETRFFYVALRRSDCLRRCREELLPGRPDSINLQHLEDFENLQVYDYLQICAYQSEQYALAASAAFTYLLAHPDHAVMKSNVEFYRTLPEISSEDFVNLELETHQGLYMDGVDAYVEQDYKTTITKMEQALTEYYKHHQRCSLLCEGMYDHASLPEFYNAIADHWISVLRCKEKCPAKLATGHGTEMPDYLAEHYNYLQFSYFKENDLKAAVACTATYLLFKPDSEVMLRNKDYYSQLSGVVPADFFPRQEAVTYFNQQIAEEEMTKFADVQYKYSDADEDGGQGSKRKYSPTAVTHPAQANDYFSYELKESRAFGIQRDDGELDAFLKGKGYSLVSKEEQLLGKDRFVVDGLLSEEQCASLVNIAKVAPDSSTSEGVPLTDLKKLVREGSVSPDAADLFLDSGDSILELLKHYYNLKWPLFVDFQTVVCKSENEEDGKISDSSNYCIPHTEGKCSKETKAWQDFMSILYLNEDTESREMAFTSGSDSSDVKVKSKCGRLVTMRSADIANVLSYSSGRQCFVVLWSTFDPSQQNRDKVLASAAANAARKLNEDPGLKTFLDENNMEVILTEEELNGPERFAVDNMIDEETCQMLIDMANNAGVRGDGYNSQGSPHTKNEMFEGLTILRAAQLAASSDVSSEVVRSYMEKSILAKDTVARYFKLDRPLYFDYTHLVCRTSIHGVDKVRTDLSHPVHSDNCIIQPDNTCLKIPPAYVQRDYSALVYLNDNFTGGDFFFTHQNMTVQATVRPKCGRMVGFNAGIYHGVEAVTSGQRCALAGWYTLDKRYKEQAYDIAENILKDLEKPRAMGPPMGHSHNEL